MAEEETFYADEIPYRRLPGTRIKNCANCYWYDGSPSGTICWLWGCVISREDPPGCSYWEQKKNEATLSEV